ncbi:hypothetical protein DMUE_5697 [Dictyocoela muelleri]|nr:hypothetical protein DMUE_5697 [Dictyocoela muelleri]
MNSTIENIYESLRLFKSCGDEIYVEFLISIGVLKTEKKCLKCNSDMSLNAKGKSTDFHEFRCSKCGKKSSIRKYSFMMGSKLSIFEVLTIIMCFCENKDNKECHELTGICLPVICKWYIRLRIAGKRFLRKSMIRLKGENKIVEIDETVISKR